ncbi:MAG TPA: alpha/beta hydrolase [Chthoniobacterales bacterium]|jgi:pimeloyl-ACP methyl ester carboxylesterase|nr:alpha/beta hydrolase [Chthoniobacterales bacterium]
MRACSAQIEDLSKDHLVVTPRLRGYPPSSVPSGVENYALPAVAEDIKALVEHFGRGKAVVIGHDWGGAVAQAFALQHAELVSGLVFMNVALIATFNSIISANKEQQARSAYSLPFLRYQPGDDLNVDLITKSIPDEERRSTLAAYLKDQPIEGMLSYYKANYPAPPYQSEAPHEFILNVPTLIIWGLQDEYFCDAVLDGAARYISQSMRLVTVPGAGHWVHQDAAEVVNREIRSWLSSLQNSK